MQEVKYFWLDQWADNERSEQRWIAGSDHVLDFNGNSSPSIGELIEAASKDGLKCSPEEDFEKDVNFPAEPGWHVA